MREQCPISVLSARVSTNIHFKTVIESNTHTLFALLVLNKVINLWCFNPQNDPQEEKGLGWKTPEFSSETEALTLPDNLLKADFSFSWIQIKSCSLIVSVILFGSLIKRKICNGLFFFFQETSIQQGRFCFVYRSFRPSKSGEIVPLLTLL